VRYIYFHEKGVQCDSEEARLTLEFGYWVLKQNGVDVKPHQFEVIDVPPPLSSAAICSPIPNDKEIGREEAFYRRTDHRLPA